MQIRRDKLLIKSFFMSTMFSDLKMIEINHPINAVILIFPKIYVIQAVLSKFSFKQRVVIDRFRKRTKSILREACEIKYQRNSKE
jgi:hypothetical protein